MSDDRHELVEALSELAAACDRRDWERVAELMLPDVEAYGEHGVEAVIDRNLRHYLGGCGPSQHLLGNHRIDLHGDHARCRTYVRVLHQGAGERSHLTFECLGEYHDTWARTPAGWRLRSRTLEVSITLGDIEVLQPG